MKKFIAPAFALLLLAGCVAIPEAEDDETKVMEETFEAEDLENDASEAPGETEDADRADAEGTDGADASAGATLEIEAETETSVSTNPPEEQTPPAPAPPPAESPTTEQPAAEPPPAQPQVRSFSVTARQWDFSPSTITVSQDDRVRISVNSVDVAHGFAISDFGVNAVLNPGETSTVEFVADKKGTFSFFCSVYCGSGHPGMRGTLVVE